MSVTVCLHVEQQIKTNQLFTIYFFP